MSTLRVKLVASGADLAGDELQGLAKRARDATPATTALLRLMEEHQARQFASDGARGGKRWVISDDWASQKSAEHKGRRPRRYTDHLMETLTAHGKGKDRIRTAGKQRATLGTKVFYSRFLKGRLIGYTAQDVDRYEDIVVRWLMEGNVR